MPRQPDSGSHDEGGIDFGMGQNLVTLTSKDLVVGDQGVESR